MERVQITGGGNGVYVDTKGRTLYTMGDYSPAVGEWVWTNGTTIYGHQNSGNFAICKIDDKNVIPLLNSYNYDLIDMKALENAKNPYRIITNNLWGYVGGKKKAYVHAKQWNNWFDLANHTKLGEFDVLDATVDDDENMVSISWGQYYFRDFETNRNILDSMPIMMNFSYTPRVDKRDTEYMWHWGVCIVEEKSKQTTNVMANEPLKIRRNAKIINQLDLSPIAAFCRNDTISKIKEVHSSGDGSGEDYDGYKFVSGDLKTTVYGNDGRYYTDLLNVRVVKRGSRDRPKCYLATMEVTPKTIKIDKDGNYYGIISASLTGYSYPWFSWDAAWINPKVADEKAKFFYKRTKIWLTVTVSTSYRFFVENGHFELLDKDFYVKCNNGVLPIRQWLNFEAKKCDVLSRYGLTGVIVKLQEDALAACVVGLGKYGAGSRWEGSTKIRYVYTAGTRLFIIGTNTPLFDSKAIITAWEELGARDKSQYYNSKIRDFPKTEVHCNSRYVAKMAGSDISIFSGEKNLGKVPANITQALSMRVAKISKSTYIVFTTTGTIYILKDGKVTTFFGPPSVSSYQTFTANTISLAKIRKLLKGLQRNGSI